VKLEDLAPDPLRALKREFGDPLRLLITPDGTIANLGAVMLPYRSVLARIGAQTSDHVNLMDQGLHVMLIDDKQAGKPLNLIATAIYWQKCGGAVPHTIHGAVYVCPDEDFA
jgi:hypothetical protein